MVSIDERIHIVINNFRQHSSTATQLLADVRDKLQSQSDKCNDLTIDLNGRDVQIKNLCCELNSVQVALTSISRIVCPGVNEEYLDDLSTDKLAEFILNTLRAGEGKVSSLPKTDQPTTPMSATLPPRPPEHKEYRPWTFATCPRDLCIRARDVVGFNIRDIVVREYRALGVTICGRVIPYGVLFNNYKRVVSPNNLLPCGEEH